MCAPSKPGTGPSMPGAESAQAADPATSLAAALPALSSCLPGCMGHYCRAPECGVQACTPERPLGPHTLPVIHFFAERVRCSSSRFCRCVARRCSVSASTCRSAAPSSPPPPPPMLGVAAGPVCEGEQRAGSALPATPMELAEATIIAAPPPPPRSQRGLAHAVGSVGSGWESASSAASHFSRTTSAGNLRDGRFMGVWTTAMCFVSCVDTSYVEWHLHSILGPGGGGGLGKGMGQA